LCQEGSSHGFEVAKGKSVTDAWTRSRHDPFVTERGDRLDRVMSGLILFAVLAVLVALVWWGSTPG